MSRWSSYGGRDTQPVNEGDYMFQRLDMKHDRAILAPGSLYRSENKRLRAGSADTRPGTDAPDFANSPNYHELFSGSAIYSNPNKDEVLLIAEGKKDFVWMLQYGQDPQKIPIAGGEKIPSAAHSLVFFAQAFDKVVLLRPGKTQLVWDGLDLTGGFQLMTKSDPADTSTLLVPKSWNAEPFGDRLLYLENLATDTIIMSDILDYTSYDPVFGTFRINAGQADAIVRIYAYSREGVVVFMKRSIHTLNSFIIDPNLADQQIVSRQIGLAAPGALVQVGSDCFFLSRPNGIYRLSQVFEQSTNTQPRPISDPIQPIIERINWDNPWLFLCSAVALGEYVYFTLPLDDQLFPQTVVVYNVTTDSWESVDSWADPYFGLTGLLVTDYAGSRRILGINNLLSRIYLMNEGTSDRTTAGLDQPIKDVIETRGYGNSAGSGPGSFKSFRRVNVAIRTLGPSVKITALSDGVNEEKLLTPTPLTKSNTEFYPWGRTQFDPLGLSDDPTAPKRKDYSSDSLGYAAQNFESLPIGIITDLPETAYIDQPKQQSLERKPIRQTGRWCAVRIENSQGQCDVLEVSVDAIEKERVVRVAA